MEARISRRRNGSTKELTDLAEVSPFLLSLLRILFLAATRGLASTFIKCQRPKEKDGKVDRVNIRFEKYETISS